MKGGHDGSDTPVDGFGIVPGEPPTPEPHVTRHEPAITTDPKGGPAYWLVCSCGWNREGKTPGLWSAHLPGLPLTLATAGETPDDHSAHVDPCSPTCRSAVA